MLTLLVFSVIRVRKWKCVKETLAIVSFVYLLNFIKGYLKMNTNVHHFQENFFISLQDCINKEEKTKKTCIEYWRREAERAKEESARRRALSIKIITEKSMILETLFLNIQKTNALKEQYERNLIAKWGGVIDDDKTKDYGIFLPSLEHLSAYVSCAKNDEYSREVLYNRPELSRGIKYDNSYYCPQEKKFIYMRNDKFRPDLELLTNPPYPDFCKNLLYFYVRSFSLHLKKGEPGKPLEIGIRNSVSKNTYEDLCIGLEILMPYMCKTESGKVIINAEGYLSCDSYYRSILVNPKTGGAELVIYRKGRFDHRQKPNTREPRNWLNEDIIIKEFPNIRIVFLYIISCRYQQHFKNRDI